MCAYSVLPNPGVLWLHSLSIQMPFPLHILQCHPWLQISKDALWAVSSGHPSLTFPASMAFLDWALSQFSFCLFFHVSLLWSPLIFCPLTSHSHSQGSRVSLKIAGDKGDQQMQYGRPYEIQDSSLPSPQPVPGLRKFSLAGLPSHPALLHPGYHHFFGSLFTLEAVSSLAYSPPVSSFSRQQLSSLSQC